MSYLATAKATGVAEAVRREARREWSDSVCQAMHRRIARASLRGFGRWDRAWRIVEAPSAVMLRALRSWEEHGTAASKQAVLDAAEAVERAWRRAAREWEKAGRPTPPETAETCLG